MFKPSPRFQEYNFVRKKILGLKILKVALKSVSFYLWKPLKVANC